MKRFFILFLLAGLGLGFVGNYANADFLEQSGEVLPHGNVSFETCMSAATKLIPGHVAIVEFKSEEGIPQYEFEIHAKDGTTWNVEVNADTGFAMEIEKHVKPDDPVFKSQAKISEKKAEQIALSFMPGKVDNREYLIEEDGMAVYEFDVHSLHGGEFKIEVEAETGKIHRVNPEHWEIGEIED